jgi:hypothetical protein
VTLFNEIAPDETFAVVLCTDTARYEWLTSLDAEEAPDSIVILRACMRPHTDCLMTKDEQ